MCPCGSTFEYTQCCGKFIEAQALPPTPEALMRSRYTAYTQNNFSYIKATMKGKALSQFQSSQSTNTSHGVTWTGLNVIASKLKSDRHGFVTFEATYEINHQLFKLSEKSEFRKFGEKWFYIDGRKMKS